MRVEIQNGVDGPVYIGWASPGTLTSAADWRIAFLEYSGGELVRLTWADGNTNFDNVYDDRAILTYS